jgi:hypothetical protein
MPINDPIECQAIKIHLENNEEIILINVYCPPLENIENYQKIFEIQSKTLIVGDFNAHNTLWGCISTNQRGIKIEKFINQYNLTLMNTGTPTHFQINTTPSAIDLTISSADIPQKFIGTYTVIT